MSAGDHEPSQAVWVLLHHQEEYRCPPLNVQNATDTCREGNLLNMAVNSTVATTATLKL